MINILKRCTSVALISLLIMTAIPAIPAFAGNTYKDVPADSWALPSQRQNL